MGDGYKVESENLIPGFCLCGSKFEIDIVCLCYKIVLIHKQN